MPQTTRQRQWYLDNKAAVIARVAKWGKDNPERVKAAKKRYHDKIRKGILPPPRKKVSIGEKRLRDNAYQKVWRRKNLKKCLVRDACRRARDAGYICMLTVEDIEWVSHCPVFGCELDYGFMGDRRREQHVPSLDRKDGSRGYVPGNVFVISLKANRLKQDASRADLEALLRYMG